MTDYKYRHLKKGEVIAVILSETELFAEQPTYDGLTTVYGQCTRTGGRQRPSAEIKLLNGMTRKIKLRTTELAQTLGKRLYETVGLEGVATWDAHTDELLRFVADSVTEYTDHNEDGSKKTIVQAFEELSEASKGRWDRCVDAWRDDPVWESIHPSDAGRVAPDPQYPSHRQYRRPTIND